ncbi:MAG: beta-eliminating lyase-related protein [Maritimibacter sp.]
MHFASDNTGPAHPKVLDAVIAANQGYAMPYGADDMTRAVEARIREIFEAPSAIVHLVTTGTAANTLSLAALTRPFETIFCSACAHIYEDECNAPSLITGGATLTLAEAPDGKMTPDSLTRAIETQGDRGVHGPQRGPVSITNVTERGSVYSVAELEALTALAKSYGLSVHLDGARFANAVAATNASPADMSWRAGVDVLSFGGTKNGCLGVEAVVFFKPQHAWEFELHRKGAGHLLSKQRYLAAQMLAYLEDGLWLDMARASNAANARLIEGLSALPGTEILYGPSANITFARLPRAMHQRLHDAGAEYHIMQGSLEGDDPAEPLLARFVADWSASAADTEAFLTAARG